MSEREAVVVRQKPWYLSKTMLFNILVGALLALEMNFPSIQPFLDPQQYAYLAMGINIVNVVLRLFTVSPVTK